MDPSRPGIVLFDLKTPVPRKAGQPIFVLEFRAVVVCPSKHLELESYATLIRPLDMSVVPLRSTRCEGITQVLIKDAPTFDQVADKIFCIMNGRVWAGHNIQWFDCHKLNDAFRYAGRRAHICAGVIDSLGVLTNRFGRRAGSMKMATLTTYFNLGQQKHRSLDDVRMNLEVLKHCATVLFLESSLQSLINANCQTHASPTMMTRSRSSALVHSKEETSRKSPPSSSVAAQRPVPFLKCDFLFLFFRRGSQGFTPTPMTTYTRTSQEVIHPSTSRPSTLNCGVLMRFDPTVLGSLPQRPVPYAMGNLEKSKYPAFS